MRGDFSAWNKDRSHNFRGTLHQQGRVLLDRDWNAQTEIMDEWQETAARDAFGAGVAAVSADEPLSFKVVMAEVNGGLVKVSLNKGHVWADGMLVELDKDAIRTATYLDPPIQNPAGKVSQLPNNLHDAVILETWLEELSPFQNPDLLIEPALGGVDTTERIQTASRIRLYRKDSNDTCTTIIPKLKDDFNSKGKLTVELKPTVTNDGDCPLVESGGFTGFEHRLYRIEIADTDKPAPDAYFKWSQFNGGLVGTGDFDAVNHKVTIHGNKNAIAYSGLKSFYLEALELDTGLGCWRVVYGAKATLVDDNSIELNTGATDIFKGSIQTGRRFFRIWNGIERIQEFKNKKDLPDNLGILIQFEPEGIGKYTPSDFWTFEVRTGGVGNPSVLVGDAAKISLGVNVTDAGCPPQGIHYHRVPLAVLNWNTEKKISFDNAQISDCREIFRPLTNQNICCTYTVGDGKSNHGDFDSIEEAISHLPGSGGQICLLPGSHETNTIIDGKVDIKINGCDKNTKIIPRKRNEPIFYVKDSQHIVLEHMDMTTLGRTAIELEGTDLGKLRDIEINYNRIQACTHAVHVQKGMEVYIRHNKVLMFDREEGDVAIYMMAEDSVIERNDIGVIPAEMAIPPADVQGRDTVPVPVDPCADREKIYQNRRFLSNYTNWTGSLLSVFFSGINPNAEFKTPGGIQIAGESERIRVITNRITGGSWNGITLGDIPAKSDDLKKDIRKVYGLNAISLKNLKTLQKEFKACLYDIDIEENEIRNMGLNGIGVVGFFSLNEIGMIISVNNIQIYRNHVEYCLQQIPAKIQPEMKMEMGLGGISLADCENLVIRENHIENNGRSHLEPVSGIFILHGEKIDISENRILNNGPRISEKDDDARPGMRGGIVIGLSFKSSLKEFAKETFGQEGYLPPDGIPAVKIHDNIVTQPLGQALFIMALGPVSVVGNTFTSLGTDFKVNPLSLLSGSVLILNLGVSKDLIGCLLLSSFKNLPRASSNQIAAESVSMSSFNAGLLKTLYLPSGNVLFSNNQTTLDLRAPENDVALSSQFIASLDDISYAGNQSECTSILDIILSDAIIYGVTVRTNGNRFQEGLTQTLFSLLSYGFMNTATSNQATHCLHVLGNPLYRISTDNIVLLPQSVVLGITVNCERYYEMFRQKYLTVNYNIVKQKK